MTSRLSKYILYLKDTIHSFILYLNEGMRVPILPYEDLEADNYSFAYPKSNLTPLSRNLSPRGCG